jgi:hypothetical protein
MILLEWTLVVIALVSAFAVPELGATAFAKSERVLSKFANRRGLAIVVMGLGTVATRLALLRVLPVPEPGVHDEFGYLLLADTFAHGRLTNPPHPMWIHFESFHINWQPTYTAMFYPAQGAFLALGQVVFGHPYWGVLLSLGLMCAAICWMLQGWLPPGWAFLGGFLAMIRFGTFSYWANSYWGGAVAAIGGALVLGALPRLRESQRLRDVVIMGAGFALIANSRPYEGLFFGLPIAAAILWWMVRLDPPALRAALRQVVAPLLAIVLLTAAAMAFYFWRTTGSFLTPPYLVNVHAYNPVPYFPWQSLRAAPGYRHQDLRNYYLGAVLDRYRLSHSLRGFLGIQLVGIAQAWSFFLGPVLTLPLLVTLATLPYGFSWRSIGRETRFLVLVCAVVGIGFVLPVWSNPHYAAPITCAIMGLVLIAMRRIRAFEWRRKPTGVFLTRAVPVICLLLAVVHVAAGGAHFLECPQWPAGGSTEPTWCSPGPVNLDRTRILNRLASGRGRQLAIVRYEQGHDIFFHEWVYNGADIDNAKVIFARDMGPAQNQELLDYFKDRQAWLVEADATPPRVEAYGVTATSNQASFARAGERR